MAKRIIGLFKNLRGNSEANLKTAENVAGSSKMDLKARIENLKSHIPAIKEKLNAVQSLPKNIPNDLLKTRIRDVISRYEKFTGVDEIMLLQRTVVEAQEKFIAAQTRRREAAQKVLNAQSKLKEIHDDMQSTPKGDQKYLRLITDEHNLIVEEQRLRKEFLAIEREEREHFSTMSAAVKLSHERERAHADRNKYWYIVASLVGTALGVMGSTLNNRMKMAEFREMLTDQMERSNNVLMSMGSPGASLAAKSGVGNSAFSADLGKHQQHLRDVEMRVAAIANNQATILEYMRKADKEVNVRLEDIKRLVMASSTLSAKSDKALKEAFKKAQSLHDEDSSAQQLMTKLQENEEYLKMSLFFGIVALVVLGIIGKMS